MDRNICVPQQLIEVRLDTRPLAEQSLDGVQFENLPVPLESGLPPRTVKAVNHDRDVYFGPRRPGRSDLVDVEGGVAGTGYHLIGNVNPIHPNVVTFEDCEDRMVKVAIIGGCFSSGVPFQVFVTDPGPARPQTLADYNAAPAEYDPTPLSLRLGAWSGGRVKRGATLLDVQATWSQLLNGDRLELAVPASAMSRWLLIRANGVVHENPVEVRCEDNRFAVNMDTLYDKSSWVGP